MTRRTGALVLALALVAAACSGGDDAARPSTIDSSTTSAAPSMTTEAPATTTTGPTSTIAYAVFEVALDGDDEARNVVAALYGWIGDPTGPLPDVPEGLVDHLAGAQVQGGGTIEATLYAADVGDGRAGVVTAGDDVLLLADEGTGWTIVGAHLARFGLEPWFGEPIRHVLVIGTDARPGQDQQNFRADSLHILASNLAAAGGAILGIPRDTYVQAPYGADKFTNVNVYADQQAMVTIASDLSGQPIEGYLVTGFLGFQQLVNAFGGVYVDVPFAMADEKAQAFISAGYQLLWGDKALGFSRNRNIPGADFARSFHQGVIVQAALLGVQEQGMTSLPSLLSILDEFTWTDLPLGDLVTLAAGAFMLDPGNVGNEVLPGEITTRGGASVVVLTDGAEELFRDLDDGVLTVEE
jgi:LCP family protein required for cell wall assembly